jgi:hypothetical protein
MPNHLNNQPFMNLNFLAFLGVAFCLQFWACSKPSDLGLSLVEEQRSDIVYTDTLSLDLQTVSSLPMESMQRNRQLIGRYEDPIFGTAKAGLYLNFRITSTNVSFPNATFDSIVLQLAYDTIGHYGDVRSTQTWQVFRMEEGMSVDETYKSNTSFTTGALLADNVSFVPNFRDSVTLQSGRVAAHLRIPLDPSLGQELLNPTGNIYSSNNTFKNAFKGIYIKAKDGSPNSAILRFISKSSRTRIVLYYTQPDGNGVPVSRSFNLLTDEDSESVLRLEQDYTGTAVLNNNPGDTLVYVQGMNGAGIQVRIPHLNNLGDIIVNKAELQLFSPFAQDTAWVLPRQLVSAQSNGNNGYDLSRDVSNSLSKTGSYLICGGSLRGTTQQPFYQLNLSNTLQEMLRGNIPNNTLYIQTATIINTERAVLGNHNSSQYKAKLLLTYTKIN